MKLRTLSLEFTTNSYSFTGDLRIHELSALPDPCPFPGTEKKRNLLEKERLLYAPMSGVGGIVYDKDAVYIELQGSHSHRKDVNTEQEEIVQDLIDKKETFDEQIDNQEFRLFSDGSVLKSKEFQNDDEDLEDDDDGGSSVDEGYEQESGSDDENAEMVSKGDWRNGSDEDEEEGGNSGGELNFTWLLLIVNVLTVILLPSENVSFGCLNFGRLKICFVFIRIIL